MIPYRLLGIFALVLGVFGSGYFYGRHAEHIKMQMFVDKIQLAHSSEVQVAQAVAIRSQTENDTLKTKLEVQHAQANNALNILLNHPADRVLLPAATICAASSDQANAASRSTTPTPGAERAGDQAQAALDEFKRGVETDAAEWSRALNACAVVMEWAKAQ